MNPPKEYNYGIVYGFGFSGMGTLEDIYEGLGAIVDGILYEEHCTAELHEQGLDLLHVKDVSYSEDDPKWAILALKGSGSAFGYQVAQIGEKTFDPASVSAETKAQLRKAQRILSKDFYLGNRKLAWRLLGVRVEK